VVTELTQMTHCVVVSLAQTLLDSCSRGCQPATDNCGHWLKSTAPLQAEVHHPTGVELGVGSAGCAANCWLHCGTRLAS
jgi:hypothetical protein